MKVRIGIALGQWPIQDHSADAILDLIDYFEALDVDSLWVSDRLVSSALILEPVTFLAYIAGHLRKMKLGTSTLVLPAPANAHEDIITIGGARRRHLLRLGREEAHARARTRCLRAVAGSSGKGEDAIERLHSLIPGQRVPHDQEVPTVGTGQKLRVIDDALFRV